MQGPGSLCKNMQVCKMWWLRWTGTQLFVSHENESDDDENNEWEENSEEVNIENDDEVHKDEKAIEGET